MSFLDDVLKQYSNPSAAPNGDVEQHFDQVAQGAPAEDLGKSIAASLRSDATPAFGESVARMFTNSNPQQQAGLLNQLLGSLGPGARAGLGGLGGVLGGLLGGAAAPGAAAITPAQASQVSPADVSTVAAHAEQHDPSIVDHVGAFYAQHPDLVKTLGAVALGMVMSHMNNRR
jgi:hypothetical protein